MQTITNLDPDDILRRLFLTAGRRDPYPWLARLRESHPAHRTATGVYVFSRYTDVVAILRDPAFAVKDADWFDEHVPTWREHAGMRLFYRCMVFHNGPNHQRLRRAMSAAFTPIRLRHLRDVVQRLTDRQLDILGEPAATGAELDVHGLFTLPVTRASICALIGVPEQDGPQLYDLVQPLLALLDPLVDDRMIGRANQAAIELRPYLGDLVAQRRMRPREDLATCVRRLTDDEAVSALLLALAAGFDTTITLLDNAIRALLMSPEQAAIVGGSTAATEAAIQETLRYDPPLQQVTRVTRYETTVGGTRLAAGQEVMALLAAANRDPEQFSDPDTFRLDRPAAPLLSFGGGPHYCLGAQLAKLEATVVLPALLARFPQLRPAGPPQSNNRSTVRGWRRLPVVLTP